MQQLYDVDQAKQSLATTMKERQNDNHASLQLAKMFEHGDTAFEIQKTGHVWRLVYKDGNGESAASVQEVVVSAQGIITKRDLPPFVDRSRLSVQSLKYIRQGVQISGYGLKEFDAQKDSLAAVLFMFQRQVGSQVADDMNTSTSGGCFSIDTSNRVFTPASEPGAGEAICIPAEVDPSGTLSKALGSSLVYTEDNEVFYMEKRVGFGGSKYQSIRPQVFQVGDIVELQMSFLIVPLRNQKSRLNIVLRGITLLDGQHTKNAAIKVLSGVPSTAKSASVEKRVRRNVGYSQEDVSVARMKFQKMEIDNEETQNNIQDLD